MNYRHLRASLDMISSVGMVSQSSLRGLCTLFLFSGSSWLDQTCDEETENPHTRGSRKLTPRRDSGFSMCLQHDYSSHNTCR